ncbi:MAG: prepilin-type N-terminal cleavage/methylation domain-containing protein [Deltaproteobacteria bacterium]|nr:prepilin-type N-terminal cleavage/methylation domain-containing protein [Deltaproteobacteria bacterium]
MTSPDRHPERGYTVIEVLAAISIFAIVATGLSTTTAGTLKANGTSRRVAAATSLVQDKVEQLRALDPTTNPGDLTAGAHTDALNPITPLGQAGGKFTRSWTVIANTPKYGLSQVVVTVSWSNPESRSVVGVTYVCRTALCA